MLQSPKDKAMKLKMKRNVNDILPTDRKKDAPRFLKLQEELQKIIAQELKKARLAVGYTEEGLARRAGFYTSEYVAFETPNGKKLPALAELWRICVAMEYPFDFLLQNKAFEECFGLNAFQKKYRFEC